MKVVILHAYSASNAGDGLLVHEAIQLVRDVLPDAAVDVLALDPGSFSSVPDGVRILHPFSGRCEAMSQARTALIGGLLSISPRARRGVMAQRLAGAGLVLGVGGGYLRGKNCLEALKTALVHLPQIPEASTGGAVVYLPQSIGPLPPVLRGVVARRMRGFAAVHVRDDRSVAESAGQVIRTPDMAILGLGEDGVGRSAPAHPSPVGLIVRKLSVGGARRSAYHGRLIELHSRLNAELLTQASSRGNDDVAFCRSLGLGSPARTLLESLAPEQASPAATVSVRLHGSLQSIRGGVPSVHLSYERKGWGAYEDLGISEYVHNVFDFDVDLVIEQTRALQADSTAYWAAIRTRIPAVQAAHAGLEAQLRELCRGGTN